MTDQSVRVYRLLGDRQLKKLTSFQFTRIKSCESCNTKIASYSQKFPHPTLAYSISNEIELNGMKLESRHELVVYNVDTWCAVNNGLAIVANKTEDFCTNKLTCRNHYTQ